MKSILLTLSFGFAMACANLASAQISEIRVGTNIHDIDWTSFGSAGDKERSIAINGEIVFDSPAFLDWALSPRPYLGATLNLEGETSHGGTGLTWRRNFSDKFYFDASFGLAIHNGTREVRPSDLVQTVFDDPSVIPNLTPAQIAQFNLDITDFRNRQNTEIDFGSRILFRQQIAIGYRWAEDWSAHIFAEHLSHGNILVSGRPNEGLDTLGFRIARHF